MRKSIRKRLEKLEAAENPVQQEDDPWYFPFDDYVMTLDRFEGKEEPPSRPMGSKAAAFLAEYVKTIEPDPLRHMEALIEGGVVRVVPEKVDTEVEDDG